MAMLKRAVGLMLALMCIPAEALAQAAFPLPLVVTKPAGDGPFPAIVIIHDCSGLGPRSSGGPWRWASRLTQAGYVTIWPDSFTTRGHPNGVCIDPSQPIVTFIQRARDAWTALDHAQSLPYVDPARVGLLGGSNGGSTVLSAMVESELGKGRTKPGFVGAVALYPGCGRPIGQWKVARAPNAQHIITGYSGVYRSRAPLLILIGELDDWTPAEPCRQLAETSQKQGLPIELKIYPGALHSFDSPVGKQFVAERVNQNAPGGRGATIGGNREAWDDSVRRVLEFFEARMRAAKPD